MANVERARLRARVRCGREVRDYGSVPAPWLLQRQQLKEVALGST
jgi:hypothetical protein